MLQGFRRWCYRQSLKDNSVINDIDKRIKGECIAYNNWVNLLHKHGFPENENGTMMNCWEIYDWYFQASTKRNTYINHATNGDKNNKRSLPDKNNHK